MKARTSSLLFGAVLAGLSSPSFADTLVIDDDGGPGVDHLQIAAAVAAAGEGDVLCIRAGTYGNFFVDGKGLTLIGEAGAVVNGDCIVRNLAADQPFTISALEGLSILFEDCAGRVVLDEVTTGATCCSASLILSSCVDVRVQRSTLVGNATAIDEFAEGAYVVESRVEFVGCTLRGEDGVLPGLVSNSNAATGLRIEGSRVHLAGTSLRGGDGVTTTDCAYPGGVGGAGALGHGGGLELVVAGTPLTSTMGGAGGASPQDRCDGPAGSAVDLVLTTGASLRTSGVSLVGGAQPGGGNAVDVLPGIATTLVEPDELDPTVELLTTPVPGQPVQVRITGEPGSSVTLFAARNAALLPDARSEIEQLTTETRALNLGPLPPTGELVRTLLMPANATVGTTYWIQAATLSPGFDFERSNSAALILR